MDDQRRGGTERWPAWWRRVVDHFRWDDGVHSAETSSAPPDSGMPRPASPAGAASLDQLLLRAADRRTRENPAGG